MGPVKQTWPKKLGSAFRRCAFRSAIPPKDKKAKSFEPVLAIVIMKYLE